MVLKVMGRALESDAEAMLAGGGRGEPWRSLYTQRNHQEGKVSKFNMVTNKCGKILKG